MKYLKEAEFSEAMNTFYSEEQKEPLTHTTWTGDFMAACKHDIACPVCFNKAAVLTRNVALSKSHYQHAAPCWDCQKQGWRTAKTTPLSRWLFNLFTKREFRL